MADFTYKVAGLVTFNDQTNEPFEFSVQNGLIHSPYGTESFAAFAQAYASTETNASTEIDALLALFVGPTHTLTVTAPVADDKTVTDLNMEVSGMVASDDNTTRYFAAQYSFENGWLIIDEAKSLVLAYDHIVATTAWNTLITTGWEVFTGGSNASITT